MNARFIFAVFLFALALNSLFQTHTYFFWKPRLVAHEYGHYLALLSAVILFFSGRPKHFNIGEISGFAFLIFSILIFLKPIQQSAKMAAHLKSDLNQSFAKFGASDFGENRKLLNWKQLWVGESQLPKNGVNHWKIEDLKIPSGPGESLPAQFYPAMTEPGRRAPLVITIHGGGWNSGDFSELADLNFHLAKTGVAALAISYRLAPKYQWPTPKDDILSAIEFAKKNADAWKIDANKIVLLGRSAGGEIAGAVAFGQRDPAIRGLVTFYAPADMDFAYQHATEDDILKSPQLLRDFLGGKPEEQKANYHSSSAYLIADEKSPPTLLIHGASDDLVWVQQSRRLNNKLELLGVPHYYLELPWATHGFDYNLNGPGGQLSTYAIDYFLNAVFK